MERDKQGQRVAWSVAGVTACEGVTFVAGAGVGRVIHLAGVVVSQRRAKVTRPTCGPWPMANQPSF